MAKDYIGARVDPDIVTKLDAIAKTLGKDRSRLIEEALARFVGAEAEIGDRLDKMQRQIDELMQFREQFASLGKATRLVK
jgi:predicted transcriptional regulator